MKMQSLQSSHTESPWKKGTMYIVDGLSFSPLPNVICASASRLSQFVQADPMFKGNRLPYF